MALQTTVNSRGSDASYFRIVAYRWDANTREASAIFSLYKDKDHSDRCRPGVVDRELPVLDVAAKLRLTGEKFDEYLGAAVLAQGAADAGTDSLSHLYAAAKAEPVVSDFGADIFAKAKAV